MQQGDAGLARLAQLDQQIGWAEHADRALDAAAAEQRKVRALQRVRMVPVGFRV